MQVRKSLFTALQTPQSRAYLHYNFEGLALRYGKPNSTIAVVVVSAAVDIVLAHPTAISKRTHNAMPSLY